jgi:hypothetical protein
LLKDLNAGLFSELAAKNGIVSPYRRQLERSYVTVMLAATGTVADPSSGSANIESANLDGERADPADKKKIRKQLKTVRQFDSTLASVGAQYSSNSGALSEYRAILRNGVADLNSRIEKALPNISDVDTRMHLNVIKSQLANVP